ncbi:hypothetical protein SRIMM317S_02551 [Streptomyces rimosus subsp. rimosus]
MPRTEPVEAVVWVPMVRTSPKSATLTRPSSPISTFSGFMSRCTSPARWAAPSAASIGSRMSSAARGWRAPRSRSTSRSVQPATYSIATVHIRPVGALVVHADDIGVVEAGHGLRLADEAVDERGVGRQRRVSHLRASTRSSRVSMAR